MRRLPPLPSSNFGLEILMGKDETIEFEDFLNGTVHLYFICYVSNVSNTVF